jgi:hypothetical protein
MPGLRLTPPGASRRIDRVHDPLSPPPARLPRPHGRARGRLHGLALLRRSALSPLSAVSALLVAAGALGCARPEPDLLTREDLDRDRLARSELTALIDADHGALAQLICDPRFTEKGVIESDPELRALALRLIGRTRRLNRLADTDVLAPGAP